MMISGLQKLTLLDFPGHVACTVFFSGCDLRCPFCHNAPLVTDIDARDGMDAEEFFVFLEKRRGILDGVAITGGEPLLQAELADFIARIKSMGFSVKLDTNGTHPDRLAALLASGNVDYVAMDVKNSREKYEKTVGVHVDTDAIDRSVRTIIDSGVEHEFRTTVVAELHEEADFAEIGKRLCGAKRYFLQQFLDSGALIGDGSKMHAATKAEMETFAAAARVNVPTFLRGVAEDNQRSV